MALPIALTALSLSAPPLATTQAPQRLRFVENGKWGYLDSSGAVVIPAQFPNALNEFSEGYSRIQIGAQKPYKWAFVHTSGRILGAPGFDQASRFTEGIASVRIGGKWGAIDTTGAIVVQPRYEWWLEFYGGRAAVRVGGKFGYIDRRGRVVIPVKFAIGRRFAAGLAEVKVDKKWGVIDTTGRFIIEPQYDELFAMSATRYGAKVGQQWRLLDAAERVIGEPFDEINFDVFKEGLAPARRAGKTGYIDTSGVFVVPPTFDAAHGFSHGRARVRQYDWEDAKEWGYIDRSGTVITRVQWGEDFAEGLAAFESRVTKGYIDTAGSVVIPPQFITAEKFARGVAFVRFSDGSWGYIDRTGRAIWKSAPELDQATVALADALASTDTSGLAGDGPFVERVHRFVELMEGAEQRGELEMPMLGSAPKLLPFLVGANRRVRAAADSPAANARLLILAARLGRLREVAEPVVFPANAPPLIDTMAASFAPNLVYLQRAMALEPTNPDAYYWMGRLYAVRLSWSRFQFGPQPDSLVGFLHTTLDSALYYGRRAVELAPAREAYREALARYLVIGGLYDEAAETARPLAGGKHPITVLVSDWQLLPVPPGAVPNERWASAIAETQEGSGMDFGALRVRAYLLEQCQSGVETVYRARWPTFRFYKMAETEADHRSLGQFLRMKGQGTLEPLKNEGELQRLDAAQRVPDGFLIMFDEFNKPNEQLRARLPVAVGDKACLLTAINMRKVN